MNKIAEIKQSLIAVAIFAAGCTPRETAEDRAMIREVDVPATKKVSAPEIEFDESLNSIDIGTTNSIIDSPSEKGSER